MPHAARCRVALPRRSSRASRYGESNSGQHLIGLNGTTYIVHCDNDRYGGGWTLILNNAGAGGFDASNVLSRFPTQPSLTEDYSIYGLADDILTLGRAWSYRSKWTQ